MSMSFFARMAVAFGVLAFFAVAQECQQPPDAKQSAQTSTLGMKLLQTQTKPAHRAVVAELQQGRKTASSASYGLPNSHAANDECASVLNVVWTMNQSDIEQRHELFPGAERLLVVDIGGNVGEDVRAILEKHPSATLHVYEPVSEFFQQLEQTFGNNSQVVLHQFGASDHDQSAEFILDLAATSGFTTEPVFSNTTTRVQVQLRDISSILQEVQNAARLPDVVNINCEGCEYGVLSRMAQTGWFGKVPLIQMSWHDLRGLDGRQDTRCRIEQKLRQFYDPAYFSYFGWQGWRLRSSA